MSSGKSLIFKRKKTHLEESMCSGGLGLDSFSDDLLKFRANVSAAVEEYETNAEDDDAEEAFLPDSTMVQNGTREENFFAKKHTAEDFERSCRVAVSTVVHTRDSAKAQLETYLQQVFFLTPEKYGALATEITKEEVGL
jgi:hypothetical protein